MNEEHCPQHPYAVFLAVEYLCKRASATNGPPLVDSFRAALFKLRANEKDFLCEKCRDLKLAMEEVFKARPEADVLPHALTFAFLKNVNRQKTSRDQIGDAREKLVLKTKPAARDKRSLK